MRDVKLVYDNDEGERQEVRASLNDSILLDVIVILENNDGEEDDD